jgi:Flp pilus assembly protein TadB
VSKERAQRRAVREAETARKIAETDARNARRNAARRRRDQRRRTVRRLTHRQRWSRRTRTQRATTVLVLAGIGVLTYLLVDDWSVRIAVALVALLATPAVVTMVLDRSTR